MDAGAFIALAAGWLAVLVVLVLDLTGIRRLRGGAGRRWQGIGILLADSGIMASALAGLRDWPQAALQRLNAVMLVFVAAGLAMLLAGLVVRARAGNGSSRN